MGFLDNSTNNIYIDAVLTNLGRKYLARNDGSFEITKFSLGDDEIDYSIIKKHGQVAGRAKIENNTGIIEALTNSSVAQKYRLISLTNSNLTKIPSLSLKSTIDGSGAHTADQVNLSLGTSGQEKAQLTLQQDLTNEEFDSEMQDFNFEIEIDNDLLEVLNDTPVTIDVASKKAKYFLPRTSGDSFNGSKLTLNLKSKVISANTFQKRGKTQNKNVIQTYVCCRGVNTGVEKIIKVEISKT
jgi:hypothetical protein